MDWHPSARRFEGGSPNLVGIHGLGASAELLLAAGIGAVWAHVSRLVDRLVEGGDQPRGGRRESDLSSAARSAIVACRLPGRGSAEVVATARAAGVVVAERRGAVRVSPAGFTRAADIDRLLEVFGPS